GVVIPKISKQNLQEAILYLPSISDQEAIISTDSILTDIQTQVDILRRSLWQQPLDHGEIKESASSINQEEAFTDWVETLPFPLASILWTY
ncbi:unnamed protein product, partial [marine sediment metagenome]